MPELERKISLKENDIAFLAGEYPHRIQRSNRVEGRPTGNVSGSFTSSGRMEALMPKKKEVIMVVTTIKMTPNWVVNLP